MKIVAHLDLDSFFASVERALNPDLISRPVGISAPRGQAMVTAATYDAKAKGVKVGMTRREAQKLCPQMVFVQSRMEAYGLVSRRVRNIIEEYFQEYETLGLDECFVEYSSLHDKFKKNKSPYIDMENVGEMIREKIRKELKITITVGIGSNKTVAKLATESAKPDGILVLRTKKEELEFLYKQRLKDVMGVGPKTILKLEPYGYQKIGDIKNLSEEALKKIAGVYQGRFLYSLITNTPLKQVESNPDSKSMGATRSMKYYEKDPDGVFEELLSEILNRLDKQRRTVRVIIVVKVGERKGYGRKIDLKVQSRDYKEIAYNARMIYRSMPDVGSVNFIGVTFNGLSRYEQIPLSGEYVPKEVGETPPIEKNRDKSSVNIKQALYFGLKVKHKEYGEGIVLQCNDEGVLVDFKERKRLYDKENLKDFSIVISEKEWSEVREY